MAELTIAELERRALIAVTERGRKLFEEIITVFKERDELRKQNQELKAELESWRDSHYDS